MYKIGKEKLQLLGYKEKGDFDLLDIELKGIGDIAIGDMGVTVNENNDLLLWSGSKQGTLREIKEWEEAAIEKETERVINPIDNLHLMHVKGVGAYDMPPVEVVRDFEKGIFFVSWTEFFNKDTKENRSKLGVHFYADDYRFKQIWDNPERYVDEILKMRYMIMPDFSTYDDMPLALRIGNQYKNMWFAAYIQQEAKKRGGDM